MTVNEELEKRQLCSEARPGLINRLERYCVDLDFGVAWPLFDLRLFPFVFLKAADPSA
jgi:hypothetical protein